VSKFFGDINGRT